MRQSMYLPAGLERPQYHTGKAGRGVEGGLGALATQTQASSRSWIDGFFFLII